MPTDSLAPPAAQSQQPGPRGRASAGPPGRHADIEFRQLRYFAVVAEELHFGRAAARLYISQPGLSQAIARLERELGVRLFARTPGNVELTEAGIELLGRGRRLLADVQDAVIRVRMVRHGEAGVVRVGVALLAEPAAGPALTAFQEEFADVVLDRSAMVSERLLEQLREGQLDAAVIHQVPALVAMEALVWEPLRRGRLAVLASPDSKFAHREAVTLSELSGETFLVNPRSLAPAAFEGLKLMCREFGGFDATVLETAVTSTMALDTDWRAIRDGAAISVMAEATARAVCPAGLAVIPVLPPPQHVLALAWRRGEDTAAVRRFLGYLRCYREQHAWMTTAGAEPPGEDRGPRLAAVGC